VVVWYSPYVTINHAILNIKKFQKEERKKKVETESSLSLWI